MDDTSAVDDLAAAAKQTDFNDLLAKSHKMANLLTAIAEREAFENPNTAIRAAQAAARVLGESATGVVLAEQIKQLRKDMDETLVERKKAPKYSHRDDENDLIGYDKDGAAVMKPSWGRPGKRKEQPDKTQSNAGGEDGSKQGEDR